jgi:hypothetical protein
MPAVCAGAGSETLPAVANVLQPQMLWRLASRTVTAVANSALVLSRENVPYAAAWWRPALAAWAPLLLSLPAGSDVLVGSELTDYFKEHVS